ncbi:MAG: STAS domain-containing protein [Pseudonocardiaceae bacterium]
MTAERAPQQVKSSLPAAEPSGRLAGTELLWVTVQRPVHEVLVVHVAGEVDMITGPSLQGHLGKALTARPKRLIIDLSQVSFLGATGLAVLINAKRAAAQQGATLQLRGVKSAVALPLTTTELAYLFDVLPSPEGASSARS